jgi:hypothetical protein
VREVEEPVEEPVEELQASETTDSSSIPQPPEF